MALHVEEVTARAGQVAQNNWLQLTYEKMCGERNEVVNLSRLPAWLAMNVELTQGAFRLTKFNCYFSHYLFDSERIVGVIEPQTDSNIPGLFAEPIIGKTNINYLLILPYNMRYYLKSGVKTYVIRLTQADAVPGIGINRSALSTISLFDRLKATS